MTSVKIIIKTSVALFFLFLAFVFYRFYWMQMEKRAEERVDELESFLPSGIKLSTEYYENEEYRRYPKKRTTVRNTLIRQGANCKNGKIIDHWGREIRFQWVYEWGGKKPSHEQWRKHLEREKEEWDRLEELKRSFTVIVMWDTHAPE